MSRFPINMTSPLMSWIVSVVVLSSFAGEFAHGLGSNGTSHWSNLARACDSIRVGTVDPLPQTCSTSNPSGMGLATELASSLIATTATEVIASAVRTCRSQIDRLGCEALRSDVAANERALSRLRSCTNTEVCEQARSMVRGTHVPLGALTCARDLAEKGLERILAPIEAYRSVNECFGNIDEKVALLGQGPWVSIWSDSQRRTLVRNMSCGEVTRLRMRRLQEFVRERRLDEEGLRREMLRDGSLNDEQMRAVIRSVSGVSGAEVAANAVEIWRGVSRSLEQMACYKVEVQAAMFCEGWASLAAVPLGAAVAEKLVRMTGNANLPDRLARSRRTDDPEGARTLSRAEGASRSPARDEFVNRYLLRPSTSRTENEVWIRRAQTSPRDGSVRFFDSENAVLKNLNSTFNDYDAVTAMTNFHQSILRRRLDQYAQRHPGLVVDRYADFKSSRFAFSGERPSTLDADLAKIFEDTNREFESELRARSVVRSADQPSTWFRAGLGRDADHANSAARYARSTEGPNRVHGFDGAAVQTRLQESLSRVHSDLSDLRSRLPERSRLMTAEEGSAAGRLPTREVIEAVRKAESDDELRASLARIEGQSEPVNLEIVRTLRGFVQRADEFQAPLRLASREVADLGPAQLGGVSADFKGMGSYNVHATIEALAQSRDVGVAIERSRGAESRVTDALNVRRDRFRSDVEGVTGRGVDCSGDDCIGVATRVLTDQDRRRMVDAIAEREGGNMRLSFIRDGIPEASHRSQIAKHGEEIEKKLRRLLQDDLPPATLDRLLFGIDMNTRVLNQGRVDLLIGRRDVRLTADQERTIRTRLGQAVGEINRSFNATYGATAPSD